MIVCTFEDREESLVGLKLLALSLARHCPGVELHACVPAATPAFLHWAAEQPALRLIPRQSHWAGGWNIKPTLLADRLDAGYREVVWLDADIVLTRDFRQHWPAHDSCVVVEEWAQEPNDRSSVRTRAFGLEVGREFPRAINSAVVRVTPAHRALIARWATLLARPEYLRDQSRPTSERPVHHTGDQDALAALLGSRDFDDVPVRLMRSPHDIAHAHVCVYASYPISHRLTHLYSGLPPLIHALGLPKPWSAAFQSRRAVGLSPYCAVAAPYAQDLGEPAEWLRPRTLWGRASHALALGSPCLRDLPTALAGELRRWRDSL